MLGSKISQVKLITVMTAILLSITILIPTLTLTEHAKSELLVDEFILIKFNSNGISELTCNITLSKPKDILIIPLVDFAKSDIRIIRVFSDYQVKIALNTMVIKAPKAASKFKLKLTFIGGYNATGSKIVLNIPSFLNIGHTIRFLNTTLILPKNVKSENLEILKPKEAVKVTLKNNITAVRYIASGKKPEDIKPIIVSFPWYSNIPIILNEYLTLNFVEKGVCKIEDKIEILNLGVGRFDYIEVSIPKQAENVLVYGPIGHYFKGVKNPGGYFMEEKKDVIRLGINLLSGLSFKEKDSITIKYSIKVGSEGVLLIPNLTVPVISKKVVIILNKHSKVKIPIPKIALSRYETENNIIYYGKLLYPETDKNLKVEYKVKGVSFLLSRISFAAFLAAALFLILTSLYKLLITPKVAVARPTIPRELFKLGPLIESYINLIRERVELEDSYLLRRIKRRDYEGRKKRLTSELLELKRRILDMTKTFSQYTEVRGDMERCRELISEAESTLNSMLLAISRFRLKVIKRTEYYRIRGRLDDRLNKVLSKLRGYAVKYSKS